MTHTELANLTERPLDLPDYPQFKGRLTLRSQTVTKNFGGIEQKLDALSVLLDGKEIAHETLFQSDFSECFVRLSNTVKTVLGKLIAMHQQKQTVAPKSWQLK